ncbi:hypothetical protein HMPREF0063_10546 [Aeromicrobium marinum DSM 15272]|uniref:UspA domain-containing protein n=1 Tax=Aeromicrobium marinum DSM 15272 TaxID=585531 RepID=E2S9A6_9ACTN|nr:hypothetical protein [Aeromicrobium marinum]EFQ83830.1 hypothetical protein HMPREF0063_10546 [Aeromicrobium marinum DSM 15272]
MYTVALLIERPLSALDADQVVALHEGLDEPVTYQVLMPVPSTPHLMAMSLGSLGAGQVVPPTSAEVIQEAGDEARAEAEEGLSSSARLLLDRRQQVETTLTHDEPVHALTELVARTGAAEAIIMTEPHLVQEFFHLDWTSRAKRHLDVPTLHLLEQVPFSGQAL